MQVKRLILVILLFSLFGCVSNANYKADSLQHIKKKHAKLVEDYKYDSNTSDYYDEGLIGANQVREPGTSIKDNYLLAIGINRYKHLPNMRSPINDARSVASILKNQYGFKVKILINPTQSTIVETIKRYRKLLRPENNLVIYYSGQSWFDEEEQQGYWLPRDAHLDDSINWLSNETITASVNAMKANHVMVISDSYYSGLPTQTPPVKPSEVEGLETRSQTKVRVVLSSGATEPTGISSSHAKNSIFCEALLDVLNKNSDGLDGNRLYAAVKARMSAKNQPTPEYKNIGSAGYTSNDFIFTPVRTSH